MGLYEEMLKRLSSKIKSGKLDRDELTYHLTNFRFRKTDIKHLEKDLVALNTIYCKRNRNIKIRKLYK